MAVDDDNIVNYGEYADITPKDIEEVERQTLDVLGNLYVGWACLVCCTEFRPDEARIEVGGGIYRHTSCDCPDRIINPWPGQLMVLDTEESDETAP